MKGLLVACGVVPGSVVETFLQQEGLQLSDVDFCGSQLSASAAYDVVLSVATGSEQHDRDFLSKLSQTVLPGGRVYVQEGVNAEGPSRSEPLKSDLLLSGFCNSRALTTSSTVMVIADKPRWETGAKAVLSLGRKTEGVVRSNVEAQPESAQATTVAEPVGDCEVSGKAAKKACKNCSCGRAEAEASGQAVKLTPEMLENPQSACGSCGLGDSFRCAGCPYKGLPPFEMGKRIALPVDFLTVDA